jgi:hypothetical protein
MLMMEKCTFLRFSAMESQPRSQPTGSPRFPPRQLEIDGGRGLSFLATALADTSMVSKPLRKHDTDGGTHAFEACLVFCSSKKTAKMMTDNG